MRERFGHQHWWPGETPFEVCVGAILTQNTNWTNVERAIARLKAAGVLEPRKLFALPERKLARLIRPAGYFNVKARRLRSFLRLLVEEFDGDLKGLFAARRGRNLKVASPRRADRTPQRGVPGREIEQATRTFMDRGHLQNPDVNRSHEPVGTPSTALRAPSPRLGEKDGMRGIRFTDSGTGATLTVRQRLLAINGIGPETADSMLLYAGGHHSFVIDAYTRRIFHRHNWCDTDASYDELKALCETALDGKPPAQQLVYWQDYHAQLVMVGKHFCRTRNPLCDQCPLKPLLPRKGNEALA